MKKKYTLADLVTLHEAGTKEIERLKEINTQLEDAIQEFTHAFASQIDELINRWKERTATSRYMEDFGFFEIETEKFLKDEKEKLLSVIIELIPLPEFTI